MKKKVLTIVIPTYNVEKYLARCLDSLLFDEITTEKLEIIIVNDGSIDKSLMIALDYEKKFPNVIKVIDKENGGHGSTINRGLSEATGKYFRVIDSDDWVNILDFPDYVQKLEEIKEDIVITNYSREEIIFGNSILMTYEDCLEYDKSYNLSKFDFTKMGNKYFGMANLTYKTEQLKKSKIQLTEKCFYVDMEYIIISLNCMRTMRYINYDIYRYFIGRVNQSVNETNFVKNRLNHETVMKNIINYYSKIDSKSNIKSYIEKIIYLMLLTHYLIYCKYSGPNIMRKEIKLFDGFLKSKSLKLYNMTNFGYIKANRATRFIFCQRFKNIFSKITTKIMEGRR